MIEFLNQLELTNEAINVYLKCLGKSPMTYYETYSLVPKISQEDFKHVIDELTNMSLLIQLTPQKPEILVYYLAIPPFRSIIKYYKKIKSSSNKIIGKIKELLNKSLTQIFEDRNKVEFKTIFKTCQEIKKDLEDETLLQKQEVEDIIEEMETLKELNSFFLELRKNVKNITQVQFASLVKIIPQIKNNLIMQLNALDLKKNEEEINNIIESLFKEGMEQITEEFTSILENLIQLEFDKIESPFNNAIKTTLQGRNDFKMVFLNMLNSFELRIKKLLEEIGDQKDNLESNLKNFKEKIVVNLNSIIEKSLNNVTALNNPIEEVMQNYLKDFASPRKIHIENLWYINSITKINEEIHNMIKNAKDSIILIVPKIEDHLSIDLLNENPKNLKINIASSDPHVNTQIKKMKEIKNLEFRNLENNNFIAFLGDDNYLGLGLKVKNPNDPLNDLVGIGSNYLPLITIFSSLIKNKWNAAHEEIKRLGKAIEHKPVTRRELESLKSSLRTLAETASSAIGEKKTSNLQPTEKFSTPQVKIYETAQKTPINTSKPQLKVDDSIKVQINNEFDELLQKLDNLNGQEFSNELEKITEFILEKKGFSVTLHKMRTTINTYKSVKSVLNNSEKKYIAEDIESWKQHFL